MNSNVVSLSGGKDSTAMLLQMLERGENIVDIVFFDTGWEFPQMHEHLDKLEQFIGRKITRLQPRLHPKFKTDKSPFDFMLSEIPVTSRKTKKVHMYGRGWPAAGRRWCTGRKQEALKAYSLSLTYHSNVSLPLVQCIGFAADEAHRINGKTKQRSEYVASRFPLVEYGMTEPEALAYCKARGFQWGGLYNVFDRVSCFCCPLQPLDDLRKLREYFPEVWARMLTMESWFPEGDKGRRFGSKATISQLDARFAAETEFESRKILLPGVVIPKKPLECSNGVNSNV